MIILSYIFYINSMFERSLAAQLSIIQALKKNTRSSSHKSICSFNEARVPAARN